MAPKLPPPLHPDPVTLEQIFDHLTGPLVPIDEKAYHLVALNTVAFQPKVKLFLCEYVPLTSANSNGNTVVTEATTSTEKNKYALAGETTTAAVNEVTDTATHNRQRRESVLKSIAFMLAQRTSAVSAECRWETVSLLGELCRMTDTHNNSSTNYNSNIINSRYAATTMNSTGVNATLERKLNVYAKANLEYLASLPWFVPACLKIIGEDAHTQSSASTVTTTRSTTAAVTSSVSDRSATSPRGIQPSDDANASSSSREAIRQRIRERQHQKHEKSAALSSSSSKAASDHAEMMMAAEEEDEDVKVALRDILRALPARRQTTQAADSNFADFSTTAITAGATNILAGAAQSLNETEWVWSRENVTQAHDLMFLDASTSMLHLIPRVCRGSNVQCAQCGQRHSPGPNPQPLLRCGSCKSVYYCSPACQRAHWMAVHRVACTAHKTRCAQMLAGYHAMSKAAQSRSARAVLAKSAHAAGGEMAISEVPLEPTLFYETRRYLYDHRDASFDAVTFEDYFMQYTA